MRQFVHRKPDGTRTDPEPVADVLRAAEGRVVQGEGRFQLTVNRLPVGPTRTRVEVLTALERNLMSGIPGDVYRVMNDEGAEFTCKEVEPVPSEDARRRNFVTYAKNGIRHAGQIHYSQARPIDFAFTKYPWTADCSGSTIAYAKAAGLPDPSGNNFNGAGNTDSILRHLPRIERREVQEGDLTLWAYGMDGKHVAIVTDLGADPMLASHGSDAGPIAIRLSAEDAWHHSETLHFLRVV